MALFDDDPSPRPRGPRRRRERIGWIVARASPAAIGLGLRAAPAPYVIEQPGPVYDTLGDVGARGRGGAAHRDPRRGDLSRPTASSTCSRSPCSAGPGRRPNWLDVARRVVRPHPRGRAGRGVFPPGVDRRRPRRAEHRGDGRLAAGRDRRGARRARLRLPARRHRRRRPRRLPGRRACSRRATSSLDGERHGRERRRRAARRARARTARTRPASSSSCATARSRPIEVTPVRARRPDAVLGVGVRMRLRVPVRRRTSSSTTSAARARA